MLAFLVTGTAYSEQLPNKPFKVCPEVAKLTDYPCVAMGPVATIIHRMEKEDPKEKKIKELELKILELEALLKQAAKDNEPLK